MFYIYKHDNDPFLSFFTSMNYTAVKKVPPSTKIQTNIYYSLRSADLYVPNEMVNILIIDDSILDIHPLKVFNYYVPTHPKLYMTYRTDFGNKLLLPMNIYRETNWSNYWFDPTLRDAIGTIKHGTAGSINDAGVIISNTVQTLEHHNKSKLFSLQNKCELFHIHNYITLSHTCKELIMKPVTNSIEIKLFLLRDIFHKKVDLKANGYYLIARTGFKIVNDHYSLKHFFNYPFRAVSFLSKGDTSNEIVVFIRPATDISLTFVELLNTIEYHDNRIIGSHSIPLDSHDYHQLHYYYAVSKQYHMLEYMMDYQRYYSEIIIEFISGVKCASPGRFHPDKFIRFLKVWSAENDHPVHDDAVQIFINSHRERFTLPRILLVGKTINRYGGSQKTSLQLYKEFILSGYDVTVACIGTTDVVPSLDKQDLLYFGNIQDIEKHIQNNFYSYVIINKLDELLDNIQSCVSPVIFISHNSMDPVNTKLISVSEHLYKVCTVNSEHQSLLYEHNIRCPVVKYTNYNVTIQPVLPRTQFKNRIVYIGRISKEKNIELLLSSFKKFTKSHSCELIIVGDGKFDLPPTDHVTFVGRQDYHSITWYLSGSDYLILPSSTEGCPFVILEALQLGIPVITSNIVGCKELIKDGYNGFRFDFHEYDQYRNIINDWSVMEHNIKHTTKNVDGLLQTLKNGYQIGIEKWNEMSKNSYRFMSEHYDPIGSMHRNIQQILSPHRFLWIDSINRSVPGFDTKGSYTFHDLYNYDIILHAPNLKQHPYLVSVLYRIKSEMIEKHVSMISDTAGNYLLFYPNNKERKNIDDIVSLIEQY